MRRGTAPLLAFLAGLLVGGAVAHVLGDAEPAPGLEAESRSAPSDAAATTRGDAPFGPPAASGPSGPGGDATLAGIAATEDERAFLRRALAEERHRRQEAVIGPEDSGLEVLRRRLEHGADLSALVADYDVFASHVRAPEGRALDVSSDGDVTRLTREMVPDGTTVIRFGPGTFEVPALEVLLALGDRGRTVSGLAICGAGMEKTTLVGLADWNVGGRVEHLVLRDFTWRAGKRTGPMLSVHGSVGARIENVRMQGWRSGGHSAALGASGPCYLALQGCEFLGKQRGENDGGLGISLRDDCVVLLEDCLFADLEHGALAGWKGNGERAGVWVRDCTFENAALAAYGGNDPDWLHVRARGGKAAYGPATWTAEERRHHWFHGVDGTVEGVALGPGLARCTTADLVRALDRFEASDAWRVREPVEPSPSPRVMGIALAEFDRGGPLAFHLYVAGASTWPCRCFTLRMDEPGVRPGDDGGSSPYLTAALLAEALPIRALLDRVRVPEGVTVDRFVYGQHAQGDGSGFVPAVQVGLPWDHWIFDARTGDLLAHRSWRR